MFGLVDLNGGELPNANTTRIEQIPYLVMRIGQILIDVKPHLNQKHLVPFYCFSVRGEYKDTLRSMIRDIECEGLPKGCEFYEIDGNKIFDMRGLSGGVATSVCCYLMAK